MGFIKKYWVIILILLVGGFLRFYNLSSVPFGLYPDEAANGLDTIRMIEDHDFRAIYDTNGPREALFLYIQGAFVWAGHFFSISSLDYTPMALRLAPALIGTLTLLGVFLLAKELFKNPRIGYLAAATMAVSAWHIQFSRNGFRAIMLPFALSFMFYFFIKAYRDNKLKNYLWFGFFLAVGFYTYLSIRMVPLVLGALLVFILVENKKFLAENKKNLLYSIGIFFLLMIPMLIHFYHVPADIMGRSSTSIFNPELNNGSAFGALFDNIKKEAMMFNFTGDENFRHNLGGSPMLDFVTGIFFWVGAIVSLLGIRKIENFLLFMWFGAMSLPMILTAEGIPHALRVVGVMPVVFIWIAMGINFVFEKIKSPKLGYVFLALILIPASVLGIKKYHVDFPSYLEAREAYSEDMVAVAYDLKKSPKDRDNILIMSEFGTKSIEFITHGKKPSYRRYETYQIVDQIKVLPSNNYKIYVQANWINEAANELQKIGFESEFKGVRSDFDGRILYYVYEN